jgi:YidC/Oxa1 family membrane protein insertase
MDAAYYLVSGLTATLMPILGGGAAVVAIIAFTMAVRILLMPLSLRALRGQAAAARLAPQLQALRQRYARQPERLQSEMAALYKREGMSIFAGITPLLLQWPVLSVMYLLFRSPRIGGKPNTLLGHDLFGVPLGAHWLSGAGLVSLHGAVFLGVFALLAGLCWLSGRLGQLMTAQATAGAQAGGAKGAGGSGALVKVLPYLTVVIAAFVPLAAGVYLLTSLAWSLAERRIFWRSAAAKNPEAAENPENPENPEAAENPKNPEAAENPENPENPEAAENPENPEAAGNQKGPKSSKPRTPSKAAR